MTGSLPALCAADLRLIGGDDDPRVLDLRVAERLGFERPRDIRKIIERNQPELERYGTVRHRGATLITATPRGGDNSG